MHKNAIEVRNLSKVYTLSSKQAKENGLDSTVFFAVDNVSFNAEYGEILCLLGANGAGKTTTLRMLSTLMPPTSGSIVYDETPTLTKTEIKNRIAFLTSDLKLDKSFTPDYLLTFYGRAYGLDAKQIVQRKEMLFQELSMNSYSKTRLSSLSSGMLQKVSIAASLMNDPQIIIYDEPTNGLDIVASRDITRFLIGQKEKGKSLIVSTHIFEMVRDLADRVILMFEGSIKAIIKKSDNNKFDGEDINDLFFKYYEVIR